jgi:hypothetical protein
MVVTGNYALFSVVMIVLMTIGAGCVSAPAPVSYETNITITPSPSPTAFTIENASQPLVRVEVVPQYTESESDWMFRNGGRYLGEGFLINRVNVSGQKDLVVNVSVYNYIFLDNFLESGADKWGTSFYWPIVPYPGNKFLFVFVRSEMEGSSEKNDPRMWGFDTNHFAIDYQGSIIQEDQSRRVKCTPIKELENTWNLNGDYRVSDFGKLRQEPMQNPTSGIDCGDLGFLRMGKSNAWDGFIIYQVPTDATEIDIRVLGAFNAFGDAWWYLHGVPL